MPGLIVDETVMDRRYWPLAAAGLARTMASSRASALAEICSFEKERFPTGTCTLPALSTRNSTLPAFASRTARPTSKVTVPSFGFGMSPRGPSTLPSRPTWPMRSGVAMAESNSSQPPCTRSTRSSAPTTSAPASRASRSFSPLANTATRTDLPMPCGSTTAPRTIWSACLGPTPRRRDRSTVSSNLARGSLPRTSMASSTPSSFPPPYSALAAFWRFVSAGLSRQTPLRKCITLLSPSAGASRWPPLSPSRACGALDNFYPHAAGGAFDGTHGRLDGVGVEVHQLGLGDLPDLRPRDLADLVLVRNRGRLRDARRPLQEHRRRGRLHDERERPILVDRHHHREDQALLAVRLRVEALAELHDVDPVLTERGAHRRRGVGLPRGDLELHHRLNLLRHVRAFRPGSTRAPRASSARRWPP